MSELIHSKTINLGFILVPIGVIGLVGTFWQLYGIAQAKNGVSSHQFLVIVSLFMVSLSFTALGSQVKITSSLTMGHADEEDDPQAVN